MVLRRGGRGEGGREVFARHILCANFVLVIFTEVGGYVVEMIQRGINRQFRKIFVGVI